MYRVFLNVFTENFTDSRHFACINAFCKVSFYAIALLLIKTMQTARAFFSLDI